MKKTLVYCLAALILFSALSLTAASKKDLWMNAITERDPAAKLQKLLEYKNEYDDPKDDNYLYLYYNLTITHFTLKKYAESIELAEKTLQIPTIQDNNKIDLYLVLANAYNITSQDLQKAVEYADQVVVTAQNLKQMSLNSPENLSKMDVGYICPALRIQARIYLQLGKTDHTMLTKAADKAMAAYLIDKSDNSLAFAKQAFGILANAKKYTEAAAIMETILKSKEGNAKEYEDLAKIFYLQDKKDQAVEYFEKAYALKGSAEAASQLGVLLQKTNPAKALDYLADEFAYTGNRESQTFKLLEHLYHNVVNKDKTQEDKEAGFNALLETAKGRIQK
jgi:tetratricopeptide (TPR) repeat protein